MIKKPKKYIFIFLWFVLMFLIFILNIMWSMFGNTIIWDSSALLGSFIFLLFPLLIMVLPLLIELFFKKSLLKSIFVSFIIALIYFIGIWLINVGMTKYFSSFTEEKWIKYQDNRYLMIDDLDNKYELAGMNKDEIIELLGSPLTETIENDEIIIKYWIGESQIKGQIYLIYMRDGVVKKTLLDKK